MNKTKTTVHEIDDRDDAPKLTKAWVEKATKLIPPSVSTHAEVRKTVRNGLVHAEVTRGGARLGAGRKPQAKRSERFTITLPHALAEKVHRAARQSKKKDASYLAELVAAHA